jgi:catechol 2,3-dioxygenase-like lactoylglutathione lyase family enzyme
LGLTTWANDVQESKIFYDAVLGALGYDPGIIDEKGRCFYFTNSGRTCEDPPGTREGATGKLYLAYLRDPSGNKICALHRMD